MRRETKMIIVDLFLFKVYLVTINEEINNKRGNKKKIHVYRSCQIHYPVQFYLTFLFKFHLT